MTEIREPSVEEQVTQGNPHGPMPSDKRKAWNEGAKFVLAISEIKEGQELREKADRLVELDENQSWPSDPFYPIEKFRIRNYNQLCENSNFRRVKVKG